MTDAPTTQPSLLVRIRDERDGQSWARFMEAYSPLIREHLRRRGLQEADASDVTQEVLSRVASAIKAFEYDADRGTFRSWLFTIVQNCLRRFATAQRHFQQGSGDTRMLRLLADLPAQAHEDEWNRQYQRQLLQRAADEVRDDFQQATWKAFWETAVEGRAPRDVAPELNMSIAAVYMAKHRVTTRLRERVQFLEGGQ